MFLFTTPVMVWCEQGIQVLLTTVGAFAAFALMTVSIGTDYWLYARAFICNSTANSSQDDPHNKDKKDPGALTHSGLWRICCLEGKWTGCVCVWGQRNGPCMYEWRKWCMKEVPTCAVCESVSWKLYCWRKNGWIWDCVIQSGWPN